MTPALVWFRRDLRLIDNPAVASAIASGRPLLAIYVSDHLDSGGASRWWLHGSLESLDSSIRARGGRLLILEGPPEQVIPDLATTVGAGDVYFTRRYEPEARDQEQALGAAIGDQADLHGYDGYLLRHPEAIKTKGGAPYKIFTPYYNAAMAYADVDAPDTTTKEAEFIEPPVDGASIDALGLTPTRPDWAQGLRSTWQPGEDGALQRLDDAARRIADYAEYRDRPDIDATSRLSPHLHFGEVSPRQVWHAIDTASQLKGNSTAAEMLLRQLYWRDFSWYLLFHFPGLPAQPLRREFELFPWVDDEVALSAWQRGKTGYPIVDAGMRQLWETGWMHNRVRMIVASFLVKHLLIPWQHGADWFLDTLVDADLASNSASWQWVAGSGTDAAPYFRIFNPITQGRKFDPDGDYIRRFVPELASMPKQFLHEPWQADAGIQRTSGVIIGENYPAPIVDHPTARKRALDAYQHTRDLLKSGR